MNYKGPPPPIRKYVILFLTILFAVINHTTILFFLLLSYLSSVMYEREINFISAKYLAQQSTEVAFIYCFVLSIFAAAGVAGESCNSKDGKQLCSSRHPYHP